MQSAGWTSTSNRYGRVNASRPRPAPRSYLEFQGYRYLGCERSGLWTQAIGASDWTQVFQDGLVRQIREDGDALIWAGSEGVFRGDHRGVITQLGSASGFEAPQPM